MFAPPALFAQELALVEQVLAFGRGRHVHAGHADGGGDGEVLVLVRLVDEQHVHAEVLEIQPVLAFVHASQALEPAVDAHAVLLRLFDGLVQASFHLADLVLQLLGGEVVAVRPGCLDALEHLPFAGLEVTASAFGADVHALERVLADDDRVPVPGGDLGPEPFGALAGAVRLGHRQDVRVRVERQVVLRPLFGQVVRHDDHRFGRPAEAFRLVARGDAGEGLAGAHDVRDERALVGLQDPRDGPALVRVQVDAAGDAREREVGAVVVARPDAVEPSVVDVLQQARSLRVPPHPFAERPFDGVAFLVEQGRRLEVLDPFLAGRVVGVGFGQVARRGVERPGHDLERVAARSGAQPVFLDGLLVELRAEGRVDLPVARGLVVADGKASEVAFGDVGASVDAERVDHEVADDAGGYPCGSESGGDVVLGEPCRQRGRESSGQFPQPLDAVHVGLAGRVRVHPCVPAVPPPRESFPADHLGQRPVRLLGP